MKVQEYLIERTNDLLRKYKSPNSIKTGHNGPYNDMETHIRNISHFTCLLAYTYKLTKDDKVLDALNDYIDYLLDSPFWCNNVYISRISDNKDETNGIIGHAWVIEAFVSYYTLFKEERILNRLKSIIDNQPFNYELSLWERKDSKGENIGIDTTFNHQLWFAATVSELGLDQYHTNIEHFLNNVVTRVETYGDGIIFHNSPLIKPKTVKDYLRIKKKYFQHYSKSVGYHPFNLYALGILRTYYPKHKFWSSNKFKRMLKMTSDSKFLKNLDNSQYSWAYNPPGIEMSVALELLTEDEFEAAKWIKLHFQRTYDKEKYLFCNKGAADDIVSIFRLYELTRIKGQYSVI
jgi:hypothetical protein